MPCMLERFTTPLDLACETGENVLDICAELGAPCVDSAVWVTDSGEARYFESLQHLYNMFRAAIEAEEEGDFRPAVYEARATIDTLKHDGVSGEIICDFREILEKIEGGEA